MRTALPSGTPVEVARPGDGRAPTQGLVLIPDIGGLRPLFDDHVARLADEQGWAVAAVEPWPGREDLSLEVRLESVGTIDDVAFLADLVAAADLLDVEPVGVTGFCMGGMFTLKAAGTGRFHRAVAFYGMIRTPERWQGDGDPVEPLDAVTGPQACPRWRSSAASTRGRPPTTSPRSRPRGSRSSATRGATTGSCTTRAAPRTAPRTPPTPGAAPIAFLSER